MAREQPKDFDRISKSCQGDGLRERQVQQILRYCMTYSVEFFKTANKYEETIMANYTTTPNLIYGNASNQTCAHHELEITKVLDKNPFWMLYDLIKN